MVHPIHHYAEHRERFRICQNTSEHSESLFQKILLFQCRFLFSHLLPSLGNAHSIDDTIVTVQVRYLLPPGFLICKRKEKGPVPTFLSSKQVNKVSLMQNHVCLILISSTKPTANSHRAARLQAVMALEMQAASGTILLASRESKKSRAKAQLEASHRIFHGKLFSGSNETCSNRFTTCYS